MTWFAASAIVFCRFKDGRQSPTPVWENVLLIEAPDDKAAWQLAEARAEQDEGDHSMTWGGRPAEWKLAGIRKLMQVTHESPDETLGHGDEITFTEFLVPDMTTVNALAEGKSVRIEYSAEGDSAGEAGGLVRVTLDQAMVLAMAKRRRFIMPAQELADAVEEDGSFHRGDGAPPPRKQVLARAQNEAYADLFEVTGPEGARVIALRCRRDGIL